MRGETEIMLMARTHTRKMSTQNTAAEFSDEETAETDCREYCRQQQNTWPLRNTRRGYYPLNGRFVDLQAELALADCQLDGRYREGMVCMDLLLGPISFSMASKSSQVSSSLWNTCF
ncbi:hypothetical protein AcW1_010121 [Taiwanofungus camphoratus]|nr:hypothetical protein AcW1_010121 [Antrodia cinnamomea]KAI0954258.1 hypothetical protein AcV7_007536 [Antrodia cinnamomea]